MACRFTVREIGFSILSQDIYTVAVIDDNADAKDPQWTTFHNKNKDCNLRLEVLNPSLDEQHPILISARQNGIKFPCNILVAPDGRLFQLEDSGMEKIYAEILETPLGRKLRTTFPDVFAAVVWVEGKDADKNLLFEAKINEVCKTIENLMPAMPKIVKNGPVSIAVSKQDFREERILLWSLGIDAQPEEPIAIVLYGRGRKIGELLNQKEIQEGTLFNYLSMIGADCECGLDKKWMLGNQVPLLWDHKLRQKLTDQVDFDVDNPLILAEMSRILAKESLSDQTGSVAFAPETVDLEEAFGAPVENNPKKTPEKNNTRPVNVLIFTVIGLVLFVLIIGSAIYIRK